MSTTDPDGHDCAWCPARRFPSRQALADHEREHRLAELATIALAFAAPRAGAADSKSTPGWQLWAKEPGEPEWRMRGRPLGQTACLLDMASLTSVLPSGSRVACVRIQEIPVERKR